MLTLLSLFALVSDVKGPDPFVGFGITPIPLTFESADDGEGSSRLRRRFLQVGAPFEINEFSLGEIEGLKLVFSPELATNRSIFLAQGVFMLEETVPFRAYRSVPSGIFWSAGLGGHLGWIQKKGAYLVDGESMDQADQYSLGWMLKACAGPEFKFLGDARLRLRLGFDVFFGRIAPYTVAVGSGKWGLLYFMQAQVMIP
jgi:hypothetical protein